MHHHLSSQLWESSFFAYLVLNQLIIYPDAREATFVSRTDNMVHPSFGRKHPKGAFSQDKVQTLWYRIWNPLQAAIFHHSNLPSHHALLKSNKTPHSFFAGSFCFSPWDSLMYFGSWSLVKQESIFRSIYYIAFHCWSFREKSLECFQLLTKLIPGAGKQ